MSELQQLKHVLREVAELRTELERLRGCSSASCQINALPEEVRDYLHQLDTTTDPADDEAVLESVRETIEVLTKLNLQLRKSLNVPLRTGSLPS